MLNQKVTQKAYMRELVHEITMLKKENEALRSKNGVIIPPEKWEAIETEIRSKTQVIEENELVIQAKEKEYNELKALFDLTDADLKKTREEKKEVENQLEQTEITLVKTETVLGNTRAELSEKCEILAVTENSLESMTVVLKSTEENLEATEFTVLIVYRVVQANTQQLYI
jgi:kinesin family protein 11